MFSHLYVYKLLKQFLMLPDEFIVAHDDLLACLTAAAQLIRHFDLFLQVIARELLSFACNVLDLLELYILLLLHMLKRSADSLVGLSNVLGPLLGCINGVNKCSQSLCLFHIIYI